MRSRTSSPLRPGPGQALATHQPRDSRSPPLARSTNGAFHEHFAFGDETGNRPDGDSLFAPPPPPSAGNAPRALLRPNRQRRRRGNVQFVVDLAPGNAISGFTLLSELGEGAFARVFLAEQNAHWRSASGPESFQGGGGRAQILTRLQHAHIVPIHSVHDDPKTNLRLICMPYLGGANLAQVLETAVGRSATQAQRLSLVDALDEVSLRHQNGGTRSGTDGGPSRPAGPSLPRAHSTGPRCPADSLAMNSANPSLSRARSIWRRWVARRVPSATNGTIPVADRDFDQPARQFLRRADAVLQASVSIIARLAEGAGARSYAGPSPPRLEAVERPDRRGRDADAPRLQPLHERPPRQRRRRGKGDARRDASLHVSRAPRRFDPRETAPTEAVDERSDLYSLGLILFEMIAGDHPFPEPPIGTPLLDVITLMGEQRRVAPWPRDFNPIVPWGLDAIVKKCLSPDPAQRYPRARGRSPRSSGFSTTAP